MSPRNLTVSFSILFACATPCFAQGGDVQKKPAAVEKPADSPKAAMKGINQAQRAVGNFLKNPKGDAPMDQVAALLKHAVEAKFSVPSLAADQPEADRAAFVKEFRLKINDLIRALLDLEEAMEGEDWTKAKAAFDAAHAVKQAGHRKFKGRPRRR